MLHLARMTATSSSAGMSCAMQLAMHLDICGNFSYCSSFDQHVCFELCISVYDRASLEHNSLRFSVLCHGIHMVKLMGMHATEIANSGCV